MLGKTTLSAARCSRIQQAAARRVKRGLIRYMYIILDRSDSSKEHKYVLNKVQVLRAFVGTPRSHLQIIFIFQTFLGDFFSQNPISNVGIIVMACGNAEVLSELSSNGKMHARVRHQQLAVRAVNPTVFQALDQEAVRKPEGSMSFQHGLERAGAALSLVPSHGCREVLLIHTSKSTVDPSDIFVTLQELKKKVWSEMSCCTESSVLTRSAVVAAAAAAVLRW